MPKMGIFKIMEV